VVYDQDDNKTTWTEAAQHFPELATYTDGITQLPITNSFEYENCKPGISTASRHPRPTVHLRKPTGKFLMNAHGLKLLKQR
jgi:hypothetical protein